MPQPEVHGFSYPSTAHVACPWPVLSQIRNAGSVHRVESGRFLVSHYRDVEYVLKRDDLFSGRTEERLQPFDWPGPEGVPEASLGKRTGHVLNVIELDPPIHQERRSRMFRFLKPARLRTYRPWIEDIVDELIDGFIDEGRVEFMHEFAYQLPTRLIIRILGLGPDDFDWMHAWGLMEWRGGRKFMTEDEVTKQGDPAEIGPLVTAAILDRVTEPRDDGLTEMIQAQAADDGAFNLAIVRADLGQFVRAGITTTGHLLSNAMLLLVRHDELRDLVVHDPARIRLLIEEVLRLESPLQWVPRVARRDTELGGVPIPEGSYLIVMLQSANRDEARWGDDAAALDPGRRSAVDHLAFGKGSHFCLGAPLGRLESQVAFTKLFSRMTNIRVAPGTGPTRHQSPTFRGLTELRLEFDRMPATAPSQT
ncbi:cytochrome P450 [Pseudonocardia sp.]|uniref:cytochrome P450 n=1 Tax=Pseudonocardia sp. TaxID=60912 RepID=UPI003D0999E4